MRRSAGNNPGMVMAIKDMKKLNSVREVSVIKNKSYQLQFDNTFLRPTLKILCNSDSASLRGSVEEILRSHSLRICVEYEVMPIYDPPV